MLDAVLQTIEQNRMFSAGDRVTVALSGGADTMCLLHVLLQLQQQLGIIVAAAHVNHLLRADESDRDQQFVQKACSRLGVECYIARFDVKKQAQIDGVGLEECGRRLRYEFLQEVSKDGKIATAHTLSDSLETVLFHLSRGTSLKGLCGIPAVREQIVRPLIDCTRQDVEAYCKQNQIEFVTDSTNLLDTYTRNRLRHQVVPELLNINPSLYDAVRRMVRSNREDELYLNDLSQRLIDDAELDSGWSVPRLLQAPRPIRMRAIASLAQAACGCTCDNKHLEKINELLTAGGKTVLYGGITARVRRGMLEFVREDGLDDWSIPFQEPQTKIPAGTLQTQQISKEEYDKLRIVHKNFAKDCIDFDTIQGRLTVRSRRQGDRIRLAHRDVTKTLKKLLNEAGIAPEKRAQCAVLADEKGIVWTDLFGVDQRCIVTQQAKNIRHITVLTSEGNHGE